MSATVTSLSNASMLLNLSNDAFKRIVDNDLRNNVSDDEARALRSAEVVSRWIATLEGMRKSVEGQLAARRSEQDILRIDTERAIQDNPQLELEIKRKYNEARKQYEKTRASSLRFKVGVEQQLINAHYIRDSLNPEASFIRKERDALLRRTWELEAAITNHREQVMSDDDDLDEDAIDDELWRVLPS